MQKSSMAGVRASFADETLKLVKRNWELLLFVLPAVAYILIFHYMPLYGIQIAFKNYNAIDGIWGSPWIGFGQFKRFFFSYQFTQLIQNTVLLTLYALVAGFPVPIVLALLLNSTPSQRFKKAVQTVTYAPHFISTVVVVSIIQIIFSTRGGFVNQIIMRLGGEPVLFMGEAKYFRSIYVWSGIWQNAGWSSILFISVLIGIDPTLYEAAVVDGITKAKRIWHIDLPHLVPTIAIVLIMNVGGIMSVGFEKVFLMQNNVNIQTSEVISTYVYKVGLQGAQYSYSAAIGFFNNVINFVLLVLVNRVSRSISGNSLW